MSNTLRIGDYNHLKVLRQTSNGVYLDDGKEGLLLPKRFVPADIKAGDTLKVFVYHDSEDRLIATTQSPKGRAGDIVKLKAVSVTFQGAFLDNGLMKDLFVPRSNQLSGMRAGAEYLVYIYLDKQTGRMAATEKFAYLLNNDDLSVKELEMVDLLVYRRTDIGYVCIINNMHTGVLHHSDIFRSIGVGDHFKGYIKKIYADHKIDLAVGKPGYQRVDDESQRILQLLEENNGFLPYHDKSDPDAIYEFFGMSKKTFKMTVGKLFKERKIAIEEKGIRKI